MIKKILLVLILTTLASCVNAYQKKRMFSVSGFQEKKLSQDNYRVTYEGLSFSGNAIKELQSRKLQVVKNYAMLRSAEIATENNYKYFYIQYSVAKNISKRGNSCINYSCVSTTTITPFAEFNIKLTQDSEGKSLNFRDKKHYEAAVIVDEMRFKYNITGDIIALDKNAKAVSDFRMPEEPKDGYATVFVMRAGDSFGSEMRFNVFLDDKSKDSEIGYNRANQYIYFYVKEGKHEIFSKAFKWNSVKINTKSQEKTFIQQIPNPGILVPFSNRLNFISEIKAKEIMQNGKLGTIRSIKK